MKMLIYYIDVVSMPESKIFERGSTICLSVLEHVPIQDTIIKIL